MDGLSKLHIFSADYICAKKLNVCPHVFCHASTGCEHLQREAYRRARSLGLEGSKVRIPACNKEGDFNPIQCNSATSKCWCVDEEGFEVPGTRATTRDLVNCTGETVGYGLTHRQSLVLNFCKIHDAIKWQHG